MAHRKWKEAKQLPGTAGPGNMLGCCLIFFHFLGPSTQSALYTYTLPPHYLTSTPFNMNGGKEDKGSGELPKCPKFVTFAVLLIVRVLRVTEGRW